MATFSFTLPICLKDFPGSERAVYPDFIKGVYTVAERQPTFPFEATPGHLPIILTDAQWNLREENLIEPAIAAAAAIPAIGVAPAVAAVAAQPAVYRPRPTKADVILRAAANLKDGALANYNQEVAKHNLICAATSYWMDLLVNAVGPVIMAEFEHPLHGTQHLTPSSLLEELQHAFGVATSAEVKALTRELTVPMAEGRLRGHLARHNRIHQLLESHGEPLAEHAKFTAFCDSTASHPAIAKAIAEFVTTHPKLTDQHFGPLRQYLKEQEPNFTTTAGDHGFGSMQANAAAPRSDPMLLQVMATLTALQARMDALQGAPAPAAAPPAARGPPAAQGQQPPRAANTSRKDLYCWLHGCRGHTGLQCKTMAADARYTQAHKAATSSANGPPGGRK